jgi:hypothetical protein
MPVGHRPAARPRRPALLVVLFVLALAVSAGLSTARAQRFFAGWELGALDVVVPTLGGQVGVTVVPHVQARITVDDFAFLFFQIGADALYTSAPPQGSPSWYVGGGPQAYTSPVGLPGASGPFAAFGLHLTGGLTFPTGPNTATYLELQPATDLGFHGIIVGFRAGVDYAF